MRKENDYVRPIGIYVILVWQVLVVIYCCYTLFTLRDMISLSGTIFGISDPYIYKLFLQGVIFVNTISFFGILMRNFWGRNFYIVMLTVSVLIKLLQMIFAVYNNGTEFIAKVQINNHELFVLFINLLIGLYLLINKSVASYFKLGCDLKDEGRYS